MVGRGRGSRGGRGGSSAAGRATSSQGARRSTVSIRQQRSVATRVNASQIIPIVLPTVAPAFPMPNAANIAHAMSNAAIQTLTPGLANRPIGIETVVDVGTDQGPRSALTMLVANTPPAGRPASYHRAMNWQCGCTDLSCANSLTVTAIATVSANDFNDWLARHHLIWQVAYCVKPARLSRNGDKILGHSGSFAIRMRLDLVSNNHVCPHHTCRGTVPLLGPLMNGCGWQAPPTTLKIALMIAQGLTLREISQEASVSTNTITKIRQKFDRMLAGLSFHKNRAAMGTLLIVQCDEFCFGTTLYNRGAPMTSVGQQWFQSIAEIDANGQCTRFFIRPVNDRTTQTLCSWIADMVCNNATITTDCWAAYRERG